MSIQKNLITLCIATLFTLGLAACGGGGGGSPTTHMSSMGGGGSPEGKYIPSGTTIPGVDAPDVTLTAASGESVDLPGLGTVECASDDGCSGTVADGVLTITGDLKIVSVDPALDSETATVLAGLAVDMLPEPTEPELTPAEQLTAAQDAVTAAEKAVANATTPAQISAAYAALVAAQAQLATVKSIPENQIALLRDRINQIQMDLNDATMLAGQRDSVGTALTAAQTAVSGLTESSSDADASATGDLVAAVEAALAATTALPETDALRSSVAAVADAFAGVQMDRTLYTQRGMVDGPLAAAQVAVDGLSNTFSTDDVAAAEAAVMTAQVALAAASALPADDPRHDLVTGVYNDLGTAKTGRTAHMETVAINDLIDMAQTAVGGLNQVTLVRTGRRGSARDGAYRGKRHCRGDGADCRTEDGVDDQPRGWRGRRSGRYRHLPRFAGRVVGGRQGGACVR